MASLVSSFNADRRCKNNVLCQIFVLCLCMFFCPKITAKIEQQQATVLHEVEAVQGGVAKLPCDITPPIPGDKMLIVIWFKDGGDRKKPIYSFDSRDKSLEHGKPWADDVMNHRSVFRYQEKPAKLTVDNIKESDAGVYHCRVDFKQSPSRNVKVNVSIILPPEKLSVLDEQGVHIPNYKLGPYNEGSSINITCVSKGGRPLPKVTWWQENALLDESYEILPDGKVRNVLQLVKIERKHLNTVFTCQASNNNQVTPISSSITLDINLRPLRVKLVGENKPLSAENAVELSCEVIGSRPPPTITWWKGSVRMNNTRETTSPDMNTTTSVLTFIPTVEDGGKYLSCRGQQEQIPDSGLEDGWKLDIRHVPLVSLELGSSLNGSTIKEGDDVYFECNIKSNPWVYKVSWRHNGKQLFNNAQANTIVSNQSLVLQSITRARSGHYSCVGHNQEGDGPSNTVQLDVKFIPTCRPAQPRVFGVARHENARILCELEANPTDVQFIWKFNSSADTADIPQNQIHSEKARSTATYKPMTAGDYGTLLCWGKNEIGMQKEPCVFQINPAGKPDALSNCTIVNQTAESLHVECVEGFNGGLRQEFIMEVYDTQTRKLVSNVTSRNPIFSVAGLESGLGFDVSLYAANKKGRSSIVQVQAFTLKAAEKHTAVKPKKPIPPENCTLTQHSRYYLQIHCQEPELLRGSHSTYLLQVYDANSRHILGTSTSPYAEDITISSLPSDYNDLLLFVRTIDAKSITSDANIIYVPSSSRRYSQRATTPVLLQITPLLGALIGVVAALILIAIIIVIVIRMRGGGERDDKDYTDDGGLSAAGRRCVAANSDKASTEPLNKHDSVDSLEEKNPDIIPQNTDDDYQDEERAFERLNNASMRVYSRVQSPNNLNKNNGYDMYCKTSDEITYAELSLSNHQMPHVIYNQQAIPMSVIRRQEPTVYAQLDISKRLPPMSQCLTLSPPHQPQFSTLQHPGHAPLPPYTHHTLRRGDTAHMQETNFHHDGSVTSETSLIHPRDSSVSLSPVPYEKSWRTGHVLKPLGSRNIYDKSLQPLLEANSTKSAISSAQPRIVTATRF